MAAMLDDVTKEANEKSLVNVLSSNMASMTSHATEELTIFVVF
jgi:hypothetical protein